MTGMHSESSREKVDEFGRNILHYAANNGALLTVKKLLLDGFDINSQDNNGWTALHFAAQNNHFQVIKLLLENKANPNIHDNQGNGALWTAAMHANGKYESILLLLKANADPNHKNKYGRSPVYMTNALDRGLAKVFAPYAKE